MSDQTLMCRDCGQAFTFTMGEQAFFQERDYSAPQRCPDCRAAKKAQRIDAGGYASNRTGGYASDSFSSSPRALHPAVCSDCGKETEVPFQPTPGKPVYCRDCFQQHRPSPSHSNRW